MSVLGSLAIGQGQAMAAYPVQRTIKEELLERKTSYSDWLDKVNKALELLEKYPEIAETLEAIRKAGI